MPKKIFFIYLLMVAIFSYSFYLIVFEDNPPIIINDYYFTDGDSVVAGETISFTFDRCRMTDGRGNRIVSLVGKTGIIWIDERDVSYPTGCDIISFEYYIPEYVPEGTYSLRVIIDYDVNPFANREIVWNSPEFMVFSSDTEK